jgi:hypothetical protein
MLQVVRIDEQGNVVLAETALFNQVPGDATSEFVALRIYRRGELVREIALGELLPDSEAQRKARKVGAWGYRFAPWESNVARYLLVDGRRIKIDLPSAEVAFE